MTDKAIKRIDKLFIATETDGSRWVNYEDYLDKEKDIKILKGKLEKRIKDELTFLFDISKLILKDMNADIILLFVHQQKNERLKIIEKELEENHDRTTGNI